MTPAETSAEPTTTAELPDDSADKAETTEASAKTPVGRRRDKDSSISYPPQSDIGSGDKKTAASQDAARARRRPLKLAAGLAVLAVLLGAFAVFAAIKANAIGPADPGNSALTDDKTTKEVQQQTANALNTLFTFDYKNPDKTSADAKGLVTKDIGGDYAALMNVLRQQGPANKLTLQSTVLTSGVQQLRGDKAQVLALMSQTYTKGDGAKAQQTPTLGMVRTNLQLVNGRWKISGLTLLAS